MPKNPAAITKNMLCDALVIGAGPAGLAAAIYLARFRRHVLVVHDDASRASWIPLSRNHPGFPDGIVGKHLLARMSRQAARYGSDIRAASVSSLQLGEIGFIALTGDFEVHAKAVLLATGVVDYGPNIPHIPEAIRHGRLRICPICDGFEVQGEAVAVIGNDGRGVAEARFLKTYTDDICLIHIGSKTDLPNADRETLRANNISLIETTVHDIAFKDGGQKVVCQHGHGASEFHAVYSALGTRPRSDLAKQLNATHSGDGRLVVDAHQQTSVPGLYAAGDVVRGLNQITTAEAEGAIAATAIHNLLRQGP